MTPRRSFWGKVDKDGPVPEFAPHLGPCWIWTGALNSDGYGVHGSAGPGGSRYAHRITYEELLGPIPEGLTIDHLCRNRACVRAPDHMEVVTNAENMRRGLVLITHCPRGHEYTGDNVRYYLKDGYQCRECRTCDRARSRNWGAAPVVCECGRTVQASNLAKHRRSAAHAAGMS